MPAKNKMIKQLTAVYLVRDTPAGGAVTTLTGAAAAGQAVVPVTSATNIAVGDIVRIGRGEEMELGKVSSIAALNITLVDNLVYNHVAGEDFVEQTVYDLGDVEGAGVSVQFNGSTQDVPVATRRTSYTVLSGYVSAMASFSLPGMSLFNLIVATGMPLANVTGAGTQASPYHVVTDGNEFNTDLNQSLIVLSVLGDGTFLREELWGVDADYTGLSMKLNRGSLDPIPVKFVAAAGGVFSTVANPYVPVATNRPGKGKVFDGLTEVGLFSAATVGPLATTLSSGVAGGAAVLPLTAVTNLVAGDWVQLNSAELVEFHQIDSIAALNANLRTKTLRAHAAGTAVVRQAQTPYAGIHEDGVDFGFAGSMDAIKIATRKFQAGLRSGLATISVGFKLIDFILSNFARALGIPQSAIIGGNRLPFNSNVATTAQVDGAYVRGMTQDGGTIMVVFWGCQTDVGSIAHALSNSGIGTIPVSFKPSSGIQFLQY